MLAGNVNEFKNLLAKFMNESHKWLLRKPELCLIFTTEDRELLQALPQEVSWDLLSRLTLGLAPDGCPLSTCLSLVSRRFRKTLQADSWIGNFLFEITCFFGNCSFTVQPSAYHSANYDCQLGNGDVCPVETSWDHIWILKHRYFLLCKVRPFFFLGLFRLQTVNSFLTSSCTLSLVESLIPSPLWLFPDLYLQGFSTKDTEKNHRCSRPHPRPSKSVSVGGAQSWIFFKIIPGCFQQPDWEPGLAGCYRISPPPEPPAHHLSATWGISLPYPHLSTPSTPLPPSHVRYSLMILAELTVPVNNAGSLCCLLSTVNSQEKRTCCKNVVPCWGLPWWSSS